MSKLVNIDTIPIYRIYLSRTLYNENGTQRTLLVLRAESWYL